MQDPPADDNNTAVVSSLVARIAGGFERTAPTFVAICLLTIVATRRYLSLSNADALLPSLMSTQHWTLFYWGQDRLANLVPLITMPVRDPIWNFRVQSLIVAGSFFGLIAGFVSFHLSAAGHRVRPLTHATITLVAGLLVMAPMKSIAGYRFVFEQLYCVSVAIYLLGAYAWIRRRAFVLGAVLVQVAVLVNPSLVLLTPLLWLLDDDPVGRLRRFAQMIAATTFAFAVANVASRTLTTGPHVDHPYDQFTMSHLRSGMSTVARNVAHSMSQALALTLVAVFVVVLAAGARQLPRRTVSVYGALPLFSALWFAAFSTNGWVEQNLHEFRYFYPLYVTYMMYAAGAVTEVLIATSNRRRRQATRGGSPSWVAMVWATAMALGVGGTIFATSRVDIPAIGAADDEVAAAREYEVSFVAGDYWSTWPVVIAGRSDGLDLFGVTYRSDPLLDAIRDTLDRLSRVQDGARVLCTIDDAQRCVSDFGSLIGRELAIGRIVSDRPLVIQLGAGP
jgi:hypothetical protein